MGKEEFEAICMNDFMEGACSKETKRYISKLRLLEIDNLWKESPDFILKNDSFVCGIEHFVIDMFQYENRSGSKVSIEERHNIFDTHHITLEEDNFNAEEACKDMQAQIQKELDIIASFDYKKYISEATRIIDKHGNKIEGYYHNMDDKHKNSHLVFMMEMHYGLPMFYSKHFPVTCVRKDGGVIRKELIDSIPITNDFITILMKYIGKADGVICMSYTADNIFSQIIYIDLTSKDALFKSLEKQRIDIYRSFNYVFPKGKYVLKIED